MAKTLLTAGAMLVVFTTVAATSFFLFRADDASLRGDSALAAGPTPTKILNDGNLGGVFDIVVDSAASPLEQGFGVFHCIVKTDHEVVGGADDPDLIKTALQCTTDIPGQGDNPDPAAVHRTPPSWAMLNAPDGGWLDGTSPGLPGLILEPGADLLVGPPPPPPYTKFPPMKGFGCFYETVASLAGGGTCPPAPECSGSPCTVVVSCFTDAGRPADAGLAGTGAGGLGPNFMTKAVIINPTSPVTINITGGVYNGSTVDRVNSGSFQLWYNQNNADCKAGTPKGAEADLLEGQPMRARIVHAYGKGGSLPNPNPAPWRPAAGGTVLDFDGDGCTDEQELDKTGTFKCGDDPQNPFDSLDPDTNDQTGTYDVFMRFESADCGNPCDETTVVPGFYADCLASLIQNSPTQYDFRPYCYFDSPTIEINPQGYPGVVGDGYAGSGPFKNDTTPCGDTDLSLAESLATATSTPTATVTPTPTDTPTSTPTATVHHPKPTPIPPFPHLQPVCEWAFGDRHAVGDLLNVTRSGNTLTLTGCFADRDGFGPMGDVWIEATLPVYQTPGTVTIYTQDGDGDHTDGEFCENTTGGTPLDGIITLTRQPGGLDRDDDQDGIPTSLELTDDPLCGQRDPFNPFDYYDISLFKGRDGRIDLFNDIIGVLNNYSPTGYADGQPGFFAIGNQENYDRPPFFAGGAGEWSRGAPDGKIDLFNDIAGIIKQYKPQGCPPSSPF